MTAAAWPLMLASWAAQTPSLTYFGDVRPLLEKSCYGCHAGGVKMGSLDLETWEGVQRGGNNGTILVPGRPRESRIYTMLMGEAAPAMPMDGKVLPPAQIETVRLWIAQGARPGTPESTPVEARIYAMAAAGAGRLALGRFGSLELVDVASRKVVERAGGLAGAVRAIAVSPDGSRIATAPGQTTLIPTQPPAQSTPIQPPPGPHPPASVLSSPDAATVTRATTLNPGITIWSPNLTPLLHIPHAGAEALAFSPDGRLLAVASGTVIQLWDVATATPALPLKSHLDAIRALAFTPDGKWLLSAGADRGIRVWNPRTPTPQSASALQYILREAGDGVHSIAVSPDSLHIAAAGADRQLRIWRLGPRRGELVRAGKPHDAEVLRVAWSRDGKTIVSASADARLHWWRAQDLTLQFTRTERDWVYGLEFLPDASLSVAPYDGNWSVYPAELVRP